MWIERELGLLAKRCEAEGRWDEREEVMFVVYVLRRLHWRPTVSRHVGGRHWATPGRSFAGTRAQSIATAHSATDAWRAYVA